MLKSDGFDLWADGYDHDVGLTEEADEYPFAGYKAVLGGVYEHVLRQGCKTVLDLGCGTAALTSRLYEHGIEVTAVDFSERMLEIARKKMPRSQTICCDLMEAPAALDGRRFDAIVSTYALHHLSDADKRTLIDRLSSLLSENGCILIGDVAFETRKKLNACREKCGDEWDGDEIYFAYDEWAALPGFSVQFEIKSHCAGVLLLQIRKSAASN